MILTIFRAPTEIKNVIQCHQREAKINTPRNYWPEKIPIKIFQWNEECGKGCAFDFGIISQHRLRGSSCMLHKSLSWGQVDGEKKKKKRGEKKLRRFLLLLCVGQSAHENECKWVVYEFFLFFIFTRHIFSVCHPNDLNIRKQAAAKCARLSFSEEKKRISQKRNKNTKKTLLLKRRPAKRQRQLY